MEKNTIKKLFLIFTIFVIAFFLIVKYENNNCDYNIEKPDKIIIYKDGNIIQLQPDSSDYREILKLNSNRIKGNVFFSETSISHDDIISIKKSIAIEYCYYENKIIITSDNGYERTYNKLLFPFDNVFNEYMILCSEGKYQSSPLSNLDFSKNILKIISSY